MNINEAELNKMVQHAKELTRDGVPVYAGQYGSSIIDRRFGRLQIIKELRAVYGVSFASADFIYTLAV